MAVNDGHGGTTLIEVAVAVTGANTAPVATTNLNAPRSNGTIAGAVEASDADGDTVSFTVADAPGKGTVTLDAATGAFTYTPDPDARHNAAADGATAADQSDTFTLAVNDGHGGRALVEVAVSVTPTNTDPTASTMIGDADAATGVVDGDVIGADADADALVYTLISGPANGTLTLDAATGAFVYTPDPAARHALAAESGDNNGNNGNNDNGTAISPNNVLIIDGRAEPNDPQRTANLQGRLEAVGHTVTVVTVTDTTPEIPADTSTYQQVWDLRYFGSTAPLTAAEQSQYTSFVTGGGFAYFIAENPGCCTARNNSVAALVTALGGGSTTIGGAAGSTGNLGSNVNSTYITEGTVVNFAAVSAIDNSQGIPLISDANGKVAAMSWIGRAGSLDPDVTGTILTVADVNWLDPERFSTAEDATVAQQQNVTALDDIIRGVVAGTVAGTISESGNGLGDIPTTDSFTVEVSDGHGGTTTVEITVPITAANAEPTAATTVSAPDAATGTVTGAVLGSDADGDTLSYTGLSSPVRGTVVLNPDGTFDYTPTAAARHNAAADGAGPEVTTDTFTVAVTDGYGGNLTVPVTITIDPVNTLPVLAPTVGAPNATTGLVTGSANGSDADGDTLTYNGPTSTASAAIALDPASGVFTYTPTDDARAAADDSTTDTFTITVADGHGGVIEVPVTVAVAPVSSQTPETAPEGCPTNCQDATVTFTGGTVRFSDGATAVTDESRLFRDVDSYLENGYVFDFVGGAGGEIGAYYGGYPNDVIHAHWAAGEVTSIEIYKDGGGVFDFQYFVLTSNTTLPGGPATGTEQVFVQGFLNGVATGSQVLLPPEDWGFPASSVSPGSDFDQVDKVVFTSTNSSFSCFGMDSFYINAPAQQINAPAQEAQASPAVIAEASPAVIAEDL